jgi:hypothetical protein
MLELQHAKIALWNCGRLSCMLVGLVLAGGCSRANVGHLAGRVTLDGQPMREGTIVFQDLTRGISVNATLQPDGTYVARTYDRDGLPPGSYQVAITPRKFGDGQTPLVEAPPTQAAPPVTAIPAKYQDVATSGLTATIQAGSNPAFNFALTP